MLQRRYKYWTGLWPLVSNLSREGLTYTVPFAYIHRAAEKEGVLGKPHTARRILTL